MAIAGHFALNFRKLRCIDDTNEVGKDEIIFYPVLVIRDSVNKKIITAVSKSQLFTNMDKGVERTNQLSISKGVTLGNECLMLEQGNLLDVQFKYETSNDILTIKELKKGTHSFALFVLFTEHDDSNTSKILETISQNVNLLKDNFGIFSADAVLFKKAVSTAINKAFDSAKKTGFLKNNDDKIGLMDCIPGSETFNEIANQHLQMKLSGNISGDGGVYYLEMSGLLAVRAYDSSIQPPICF